MSQYLGDISAYALAVSQGYTGTEEEYAELMASYATVGQTAVTAAQTAATKASEAATSATTATNKATEATTAATTATNKAAEAQADADAAALDASQALSAASTATTKATEATTAAATATSAKTDAVAANTAAQSAKTAAQTAQTGAETAAASVSASAAQIQTNADDISELKEDLSDVGSFPEVSINPIITYNQTILPDGSITSAGATFGVTSKIDVSDFDHFVITTTMGWGNLLYAFYESDDTFISGEASPSSGYATITNKSVTIPVNAAYLRVAVSNNPYSIKGVNAYTLDVQDDVEKLNSAIPTKIKYNDLSFDVVGQKYINNLGGFTDAAGDTYYITDYVDVSEYTDVYITASANWSNCLYAFYDSNKNVVAVGPASTNSGTFTTLEKVKIAVPLEATYIVVAGRTTSLMPEIATFNRYVPVGKWYGKKWVCVGDSLTEQNAATSIHYYDYVSETTDITPVIMGVSGSGYARKADQNQAFYQRISSCPTDADVVTIFGSFNDLGAGLPIGSVDDNGTTTIAGCINKTIDNLQTVIPLVNLGIVAPTPWDTTQPSASGTAYDYVEMLKAICARRSIPFLDLWRCSNLRPWDADFRAIAYSHDGGSGTHPDENGHKLIAPRFKAFLESLLI